MYTHEQELLHRKLVTKISVTSIDLNNFSLDNIFMSLLKNPGNLIFHMVLHRATNTTRFYKKMRFFIDFWTQLSPRRLKCLIIVFNENLRLKSSYDSTLRYAWINKYLDVTIMEVIIKTKVEIFLYNYNPFDNKFLQEAWGPKAVIFPDKLKNIYEHPINVIVYDLPPHLSFKRNTKGVIEVVGIYYKLLEFISKSLNFTINPLIKDYPEKNRSLYITLKRIEESLHNARVNITPIPMVLGYIDKEQSLEISMFIDDLQYVAVVPILKQFSINLSTEILSHVFIFAINVIIVLFAVCAVKYKKLRNKIKSIIRIRLNDSISRSLQSTSQRIFYLCIILVFFQYINNFFITLINFKLIREEIPLNTLEEIEKSNLTPYFDQVYIERIFTYETKFLESIKSRIVSTSSTDTCIDILVKFRNNFCVMSSIKAAEFVQKYKNIDGTPIMKIAKPSLFAEKFVYFFEKSSPYVDKFNKIIQLTFESGVFEKLITIIKYEDISVEDGEQCKQSSSTPIFGLISILIIGYTIAFLEFCKEYVEMYLKRKRNIINK